MKATALLTEDHRQIARALKVLAHLSARTSRNGVIDANSAKDLLDFLQQFADRHHQGKEEGLFFPALLQDRDQKNYRSLSALIFEHNRERSLCEGLEESIRAQKAQDFVHYADRIVEVLQDHIDREEHQLFRLAEDTLDAKQDERVAADLQNYERSWQETGLPNLLEKLSTLEANYLGVKNGRRAAHG